MPAIALRGMVLFPGTTMHLEVGRSKSISAVEYALEKGSDIYLVAQKDMLVDEPVAKDLHSIGTVGKVKQVLKMKDGIKVLVKGIYRASHTELFIRDDMIMARVGRKDVTAPKKVTDALIAKMRMVKQSFEEYVHTSTGQASSDMSLTAEGIDDPAKLVNFICSKVNMPYPDLQAVLAISSVSKQLEKLYASLEREISVNKIERELYDKVKNALDNNQREFVLREQKHIIEQELGEHDDISELEEMKKKVLALGLSKDDTDMIMKNISRMEKMPPGSQEGMVIQTQVETILDIPWNVKTKQNFDLKKAEKILERDHYGLKKVKERMLELVAVQKLTPRGTGQILCLVGPPGVGKTSIARSIAEAMGRNFVRISLGGVRDEAEIRGHRKTYVGSMPGCIVKALIEAKSSNPLILLDEIDKLGNDYKGDPASALLEVLDREQNGSFRDHYIELGVDLSDVIFLTSANDASTIPGPLYDRMEMINLSGYTDIEKYHIAKNHLVPKQVALHGMNGKQLKFSKDGIYELIEGYTREAGVRELERQIAAICRKTAKMLVSGEKNSVSVTAASVKQLLGRRKYDRTADEHKNRVGRVTGLAWTAVGGDTLPIEVSVLDGTGKVELTGSLGDVMQESAKIAISYVRSIAGMIGVDPMFYKNKDIHLHAPEGAVPKDGPSAGVTMVTSLVSALTGIAANGNVAMTGEITLQGDVLAIGGLKEKSMAAYKQGYTTVVIPKANVVDIDEFDEEIKQNLVFKPVENIGQVLSAALCEDVFANKREEKELAALTASSKAGKQSYDNSTRVVRG
ncbi:MAG: endopeptidase La [Oscillospiraceae bacterium]|nr:endopeptidase La [Oscillospiraceae bacterium]